MFSIGPRCLYPLSVFSLAFSLPSLVCLSHIRCTLLVLNIWIISSYRETNLLKMWMTGLHFLRRWEWVCVLRVELWGLHASPVVKTLVFQCRGHRFSSWSGVNWHNARCSQKIFKSRILGEFSGNNPVIGLEPLFLVTKFNQIYATF